MIVLRTPKGWTGPKEVDGLPAEGTFRSHQVPLAEPARQPGAPARSSSEWLRSYRPEELFDEGGAPARRAARAAPRGRAADGRQPARQRRAAAARPRAARLPRLRRRRRRSPAPTSSEATRVLGALAARRHARERTAANFRVFGPDETASNRLGAVFEETDRAWMAELLRRRRPPLARRAGDGGPQRAPLPGLARGLPAHRPPRALQLLRGVHPHRRLDVQPARQVAEGHARDPVAQADRVAQLPALVARLAPGPQRLLASGPRLHRPRREQEGGDRPRLPAAGRELPAVGRRPLPALARLRERHRRRQAAVARLPLDGGRRHALHPRDRHLGMGVERGRRGARRGARVRRRHPDARDRRRRGAPARAPARPAGAGRERRRPDAPAAGGRASARPPDAEFDALFTTVAAGDLRLPRLSLADPPPDLPARQPPQPPRARLQGGGHHHDAVRHGHAQRPRPVPPRDGRDRPGAAASARRRPALRQQMADERLRHRAYTRDHGDDSPECATGPGPADATCASSSPTPGRAASSCRCSTPRTRLWRRDSTRQASATPEARGATSPSCRPRTRSGTASCTAASAFARPSGSTTRCCRRCGS